MDASASWRGGEAARIGARKEIELAEAMPPRELAGGGGAVAAERRSGMVRLILASMVAGGVQYGWALQLSLLTPYVQTLGMPHSLSSMMWLCGPIAGFLVQPTIGFWSDRCRSRFGRRRPFILVGCILICCAVLIIGFSSDIGFALGDTKESCSVYTGKRMKAALVYILGFWVLDLSNNAVQGPTRALMADLAGPELVSAANAIFCSWMAFGNILGYSSGASGSWHKWFPFLKTEACCVACANLKGAFLIAVIVLTLCLSVTLYFAKEVPFDELADEASETGDKGAGLSSLFSEMLKSFKNLPPGMPAVLLVTSLTWLSWFPFNTYDTDWMGREIYHGNPDGTPAQRDAFDKGVREGAFGLLLNSIVLGVTSFLIEPMCRKFTPRVVWAMCNLTMCLGMVGASIVGAWSIKDYKGSLANAVTANTKIRDVCLFIFTGLGFPLAILFSVPFAVTAQLVSKAEGGQGLCTGVLNISIVIPQIIVSLTAGPWDAIFGGSNIPAFAAASVFSFVCMFCTLFLLPKMPRNDFKTSGVGGGAH